MTTRRILMATACAASLCGALYGQTGDKTTSFQYFVTNDAMGGKMSFRMEGMGEAVSGKPFSATEERQTVQVLGDGTRIDKKETDKYYRDAQGRTRIERDGGDTIIISDPVAGFSAELSAASKTAHKMVVQMRKSAGGQISVAGGPPNIVMLDKMKAEMAAGKPMPGAVHTMEMTVPQMGTQAGPSTAVQFGPGIAGQFGTREAQSGAAEELGTQIVNGVPAQGTRSTITIPAGQIGNDREIKVVSERWYSTDLQMLIKSSNNDPRFGETTYQLTNVIQGAQDPSLFSIPADYNVNGPR